MDDIKNTIKVKKEALNKVFGCLSVNNKYLRVTDNYPAMMYPDIRHEVNNKK